MLFTDCTYADHFAKDPAVVKFGGGYLLYYSLPGCSGCSGWSIGIARSSDLENWEVVSRILPEQECEKGGICAPGAVVLKGRVHLFYQTYGGGKNDSVCHAVSGDGIRFERDPSNPVFRPEATWCCGRAIDADVCVFGGRLLMYFATRDHAMKIQKLGAAAAELGSGFSRGAWKPLLNQNILTPELLWEGDCIEAPASVVRGGKVYLFYGGSYNCTPQQIGCAVSGDGVHFTRLSAEPFLANGEPGSWNRSESGHPYAFEDGETVSLFYQGSADGGKTWYLSRTGVVFENGMPHPGKV